MVSAFSVPKASRHQKYSSNPGPGSYNPEDSPKAVKPTDPRFSFGKDIRKSTSNLVPGPGSYQPGESLIADKKPSYSMMARRELSSEKLNVGPGQYSPTFGFGKEKSPSFSMRGKQGEKSESKPGPGQYEYRSHLAVKEKGHNFGKEMRSKFDDSKIPGPGSYQYQNAKFKYGSKMEPSYGFGSRIAYNTDSKVPGPGAYQPKKEIYSHIGGIVGKDLRDSLVMSQVPGPGNYEHTANFKEKSPTWSLSKSARDYSPSSKYNVGPGQYEPTNGYKKVIQSPPSYNIAGKAEKLKYDISPNPGPGTYERELLKSRKSIKIAQKLKDLQGLQVPGPGVSIDLAQSYQQFKYDNDSWAQGGGRYSISKDVRIKNNYSYVPGPGQYQNKSTDLKSPSGKVTFGREQKLKHEAGKNPGPGHYQLKPTFADVPKYLLPNA